MSKFKATPALQLLYRELNIAIYTTIYLIRHTENVAISSAQIRQEHVTLLDI